MGRKGWLNIFLAICLFFSFPLPQARPEVGEVYPYDSVAFWSGVLSGEVWVNLSPFAKEEQLSSGQIVFPEMTDLLLYYDYRLKEVAKELVASFASEEESVFRVWLVPEVVSPEVRFEVKAEGAEGIQEILPELVSIVNASQEFYPLRRAVYWFYRGRKWAGEAGLLRRKYTGRAYLKGTDWILTLYHRDLLSEEGMVGGIELPLLNIGADAYHAVEVEDFASRLSRIYGRVVSDPDLSPGEKMYVLLSDLGMGLDKLGIEDIREMFERIWRRDEVWFAEGLMELAQRQDLLEPLILNWFFISRNPAVVRERRYNPTVDFFRLFYSQFPVHARELLDSAIEVFRDSRHEDIYRSLLALKMYLTKRSLDELLGIGLEKKDIERMSRLGIGEDISLFIAGLGSPGLGLDSLSLSRETKGFYLLGKLIGTQKLDLDEKEWLFLVEFLGDKDLFTERPWLQDYLNNIASILGSSCPPDKLAGFLERLSSDNPILFETMAKSDTFLNRLEGVLPYLKEISLKTLVYLWSSIPEGKSGREQIRYLLWNRLDNPVSAINRIYYWQEDPYCATALLDFLVQRSMPNKLLEGLFADETLPLEVRLRAGLYLALRDNKRLGEVWDSFLNTGLDKGFVEEILSSCADPRLLEQKIKAALTLLTPTVIFLSGQEVNDDFKRWMLEKILFARTVIRGGFLGDASYGFHPLNMALFARSNVSLLVGSILAHEVTHNLVYGLLEERDPNLEPGDLARDVFTALISEFLADVGGLAVVERVLGGDGLRKWSGLLGRLFPLTILGENRPILVHSLEQYLLNRLLEKGSFQEGMTFSHLFQRALMELKDTNILDARSLDVLGFFESVLGGLFDPSQVSDLVEELKVSLREGKLSLVYPRWDPSSLWSLGEEGMSRRAFLRRLAVYGGLGTLGTSGLIKISRMLNPLVERSTEQSREKVYPLEEEEPIPEQTERNRTVDPLQVREEFLTGLERLKRLLRERANDVEEIETLRGVLLENFLRLAESFDEEELRRLAGYAGSVDYRLSMDLLRQMVSRITGEYLAGDVERVLDIVDRVCANAWRYRNSGDVSRLFDREMRVYLFQQFGMKGLTQRFIRYMSNPFWVFPVVSAQAYMAERGLDYPLQEIFAFAIKEGYDKFGKALEERNGLIWTNKWPVGLDRFGAPRVRFGMYSKGWLPEGFEGRFVEETGQKFHNRLEVFPVVRFRALGGPLGAEYPALLAMVALIKQDEVLMLKALRRKGIARREHDIAQAHPSKRMFLRYLFYNSPTREEYRILTLTKDLLVPLDQRLPTWLIRSKIRNKRLALQVDKAVRATAISDAVRIFLPGELNDEVDRSLSRLLGVLYAPIGGMVKQVMGKSRKGKEINSEEVFIEVKAVLDDHLGAAREKDKDFVGAFRQTQFYKLCAQLSRAIRSGDSRYAEELWDKLLPVICQIGEGENKMQKISPRVDGSVLERIVLKDIGDYFLYRLGGIHGLVSLLPRVEIDYVISEDGESYKKIKRLEDFSKYRDRVIRFFTKWLVFRDLATPLEEMILALEGLSHKRSEATTMFRFWSSLADDETRLDGAIREFSTGWDDIMKDFVRSILIKEEGTEVDSLKLEGIGTNISAFLYKDSLLLPRPFDTYRLKRAIEVFPALKGFSPAVDYVHLFSDEVYLWQDGAKAFLRDGPVYRFKDVQWLDKEGLFEALHSAVLQGYTLADIVKHPKGGYLLLVHRSGEPISEEELALLREIVKKLLWKTEERELSKMELDLLAGALKVDSRLVRYWEEMRSLSELLGDVSIKKIGQLAERISSEANKPGGIILK